MKKSNFKRTMKQTSHSVAMRLLHLYYIATFMSFRYYLRYNLIVICMYILSMLTFIQDCCLVPSFLIFFAFVRFFKMVIFGLICILLAVFYNKLSSNLAMAFCQTTDPKLNEKFTFYRLCSKYER